jgi:hypothetical protein
LVLTRTVNRWLLPALALAVVVALAAPGPAVSGTDREARALEELARQARRQADALERIAERLK